jgi:hypothetical protein
MRTDLRLLLLLALWVAPACVSGTGARSAFTPWPSKPPDCPFEVFEEREPPRPYEALGALSFDSNPWLGEKGRKEALRETACRSGADAVLLSRPSERKVGTERVRTYEARFVVYTDVPPPPEVQAARAAASQPPPPPPPSDAVVVPAPDWMQDVEGTVITQPAAEPSSPR